MGRISYEDALKNPPMMGDYSDKLFYNNFTLKNDKDEAIVRIMHDSPDDFDIVTVHSGVKVREGQYRDVSCLRHFTEPLSKCPLCESGMRPTTRIIIHMLQYTKDEAGNIVATPVIWNRSYQYIEKLKSYIDNYGPLSDILCKIIRNGAKGSMQTTYEIVPNLSNTVYPADVYVKDEEPFKDYQSVGTAVWTKSEADMRHFVMYKEFPSSAAAASATTSVSTESVNVSSPQPAPQPAPQYAPASAPEPAQQFTPQHTPAQRDVPPWERNANSAQVTRPVRPY